ncbi:MAG: ATP-dependent DNA helicase RecG [Candidatus Andersenbacteria bacterium]
MALKLSSPVTDIHRIGPAKAKALSILGITHVRDFLYTFPRRYDDFSVITPIAQLVPGQKMTVRGRVKTVKSVWGFQGRRRVLRIFVEIEDATGVLQVTWYNLRFLVGQLQQGRELYVAGMVEEHTGRPPKKCAMRSPVIEFVQTEAEQTHTARITPVYPETHGVSSRFLRYQVKNLLPLLQVLPEYLPANIRQRNQLVGIQEAISAAHFPASGAELTTAQRRLRFDELFFLQMAALVRRQQRFSQTALPVPITLPLLKECIAALPFALTAAQHHALTEVMADLALNQPMNRLLQGDVGSGKSAVALIATNAVLRSGFTVLYLAPTEILARQQADSFTTILGQQQVALLLGATKQSAKDRIKQRLRSPEALCVVGTHALLQEDVKVQGCALAIIDEQHRFGVAQRHALQNLSGGRPLPHLLSMTATPIPRTLSLTVYGDLDVSILDELPPGRQPVQTEIVMPDNREPAILHILQELHAGRQAYVIAPLVEQSDRLEIKSAKETAAEMHQLFPDIAIGLLHGQMQSSEKESVTRNFAAGALQLLVSTSIVEVGINVPNATIMIIEGAERFGLSQLHQFRGRIGRGTIPSYCYLFPTTADSARSERLQILTSTTDGFVVAEKDLALRGPGEVYGLAQSGFGNLQVASLLDYPLIKLARQEAARLLKKDPTLARYPIIRKKVEQKNLQAHFE